MTFAAPWLAVALAAVPVLAWLYVRGFRRRRRALAAFFDSGLDAGLAPALVDSYSWRRRAARAACLVGAAAALAVAAMQPQWGREAGDAERRGRDIYIVLDVSRSMLAEDTAPNRLEAAKAAIAAFSESLREHGGYRLGLVIFAGRTRLQSPLTLDYAFFRERLAQVNTGILDRRGSALADAVRKTLFGFGALDAAHTDFIVIGDGEDHRGGVEEAARQAADEGVGLYTVGVGDPATGGRIPVVTEEGARQYLRFEGADVVTMMNESRLRAMARAAGGSYVPARTGPIALDALFEADILDKPRRELETEQGERKADRYAPFALLALLLLVAEMMVSERPGRPRPRSKEA